MLNISFLLLRWNCRQLFHVQGGVSLQEIVQVNGRLLKRLLRSQDGSVFRPSGYGGSVSFPL